MRSQKTGAYIYLTWPLAGHHPHLYKPKSNQKASPSYVLQTRAWTRYGEYVRSRVGKEGVAGTLNERALQCANNACYLPSNLSYYVLSYSLHKNTHAMHACIYIFIHTLGPAICLAFACRYLSKHAQALSMFGYICRNRASVPNIHSFTTRWRSTPIFMAWST